MIFHVLSQNTIISFKSKCMLTDINVVDMFRNYQWVEKCTDISLLFWRDELQHGLAQEQWRSHLKCTVSVLMFRGRSCLASHTGKVKQICFVRDINSLILLIVRAFCIEFCILIHIKSLDYISLKIKINVKNGFTTNSYC